VEIDGGQHGGARDVQRQVWIEAQGFVVLRFWNNEVLGNIEGVLLTIASACAAPPPSPLPEVGGGADGAHAPPPTSGRGLGGGETGSKL